MLIGGILNLWGESSVMNGKMESEKFVDRARELVGTPDYVSALSNFSEGHIFGTTLEMGLEKEDVKNIWSGIFPRVNSLFSQYKNSEEVDIALPLVLSVVDYINKWKMYYELFKENE